MIGILCEKPSAARNFAKALGGMSGSFNGERFIIKAARGHLFEYRDPHEQVDEGLVRKYRSWDVSNLPWHAEDFRWKRGRKKDTTALLKDIKSTFSKCDELVIATDMDASGEGNLIAWEIFDELRLRPKRFSRMEFLDESVNEIQRAFVNRRIITRNTDGDLAKALYRQKWDFLSMQFTRIATGNGDGTLLRQGRLKSAMVQIVGDQLKAIAEYKKVPFYQNRFRDENGVVYEWKDEPRYERRSEVPQSYHPSAVVVDGRELKKSPPPKLLDLAALSARLSSRGFRPKDVLDVYQKMYEDQVVSYPRTDDKTITEEQFWEFEGNASRIAEVVGIDIRLLSMRSPRKSHVRKGGSHGANRPGSRIPESLEWLERYDRPSTKGLAAAIYETLAKNALAMLAPDYEYEKVTAHVADYPEFKASVSVPRRMNWKLVFEEEKEEKDKEKTEKEPGKIASPFVYEGFPPKPTAPTMKWLVKQLEQRSVGTGATRTSTFAEVTTGKNALLQEKRGKITMAKAGEMSYHLLKDTCIGDLSLTEKVYAQMDLIGQGKGDEQMYFDELEETVRSDARTMEKNGQKFEKKNWNRQKSDDQYAHGNFRGEEIRFKKTWSGHDFTQKEISDLLAGKEITITATSSKSGKNFTCTGMLEKQTYNNREYYGFKMKEFVNDRSGGKARNDDDYARGSWNGRDVRFKKTFSSHRFSDDEVRRLLDGETIEFEATSKAGKPYTARGCLQEQEWNGRSFVGFKLDFGS